MTVSIIIAVKTWQKNLEECVGKCLEVDFPDYDILILPDSLSIDFREEANSFFAKFRLTHLEKNIPLKIIPTGPVTPPQKRDLAINYTNADILAFIDDDAYPEKNWLKNAIGYFKDPQVAAVGGPAVTAPSDNLRQKAGGAVYSSFVVSGGYIFRFLPKMKREVDDYPSCNLLVRRWVMQELSGFATRFWPGEDTKLCLDITKKLNKKIIYGPEVLVYHHRRPLFIAHLKQIAGYALHRGYFVKNYPQNSRKLSYFLPSLFLIAVIGGGILIILLPQLRLVYLGFLILYLITVLLSSISQGLALAILVFPGIILTHLIYGFYFIKGMLTRKLKEEL